MAAQLAGMPFIVALDNEGNPVPSALLYVYDTGTTNNHDAFETDALSALAQHEQPIEADSAGRFPQIFLDSADGEARFLLKDADGNTLADIDPVNPAAALIVNADITDGTITAAKATASFVADSLGFTPASAAGGSMSGQLKAHMSPTALDGTEFGPFAPAFTAHNTNYTLVIADAFKALKKDDTATPTWTIPPNSSVAFPVGTRIPFANIGASGVVTIARGSGVSLRLANNATSGDRSVAAWGAGTLWQVAADSWLVVGSAGVT